MPTNLGSLKLYLTHVRVDIFDGDANDYVTKTEVFGNDYDTVAELLSDTDDRGEGGAETYEIALATNPSDCSGYKHVLVVLDCVCTTANELDITSVQLKGYYAA